MRRAQYFTRERGDWDFLEEKTYFRFDIKRRLNVINLEEQEKLDNIGILIEVYLARLCKREYPRYSTTRKAYFIIVYN